MKLERNARVLLNAFPFWAVPYTIYTYYLSLFLMEEGLSSANIATLMTVANASALLISFVTAPIVDRMGRRLSALVFDLLSASLPCLLFLAGGNIVVALVAQALTGLNRITSTGFYLLMIEDTSDENSVAAMNWFNIILVGSGLCTPIAGLLVSRVGLIAGERFFLMISAASMALQTIVRHLLVRETPTGLRIRGQRERSSAREILRGYAEVTRYIARNGRVASAMVINALVYVYYTVGTTISLFFTPYFADYRGLSGVTLGMVGGIYAGGTLFSMLFINPRVKPRSLYPYTIVSSLVSLAGFALMMLCPKGNTALLFVAVVLISVSYGSLKTIADSILALEMNGEYSSALYSFSFIVSSVLGILAIQILQALYSVNPNWLFGSSAVLVALVLLDALVFVRKGRRI